MKSMKRSIGYAIVLCCVAGAALAHHLPRRTHIVHPPAERTQVLKPVQGARELPAMPDARIEASAKRAFSSGTLALLLIDKGGIAFEQYATDVNDETPLFALSMTKSLVALAAGAALCGGQMASIDDQAGSYSTELDGSVQGKVSIRHLLMMASGADPGFMDMPNDGINNKDLMALFSGDMGVAEYVRKDSKPLTFLGRAREPGSNFVYNGRDTTALSLAIEGATNMKFQEWLEQSVWRQAAAAHPAYLRVAAKDGRALAEVGLWIVPRDMARIGLWMLDTLKEEGSCMQRFVADAIRPGLGTSWRPKRYGYQMWTDSRGLPQFIGHSGQMLTIDPQSGRMLVAFGFNVEFQPLENLFHEWLDQRP